jgi:hypothetical protein
LFTKFYTYELCMDEGPTSFNPFPTHPLQGFQEHRISRQEDRDATEQYCRRHDTFCSNPFPYGLGNCKNYEKILSAPQLPFENILLFSIHL